MASLINNGRTKKCKDTIGGIRSVYFAPFKKVLRSQITLANGELTAFPQTFVYKFEVFGSTFSQAQTEDSGGKFFAQTLSISFNKITAFDNVRFRKMIANDYFCVIEDRNGNFVLGGFRNGLDCTDLKVSTSGGYDMTFNGREENFAPYCKSLVGTVFVEGTTVDLIFQNADNYIFQNNDNFILNEY